MGDWPIVKLDIHAAKSAALTVESPGIDRMAYPGAIQAGDLPHLDRLVSASATRLRGGDTGGVHGEVGNAGVLYQLI